MSAGGKAIVVVVGASSVLLGCDSTSERGATTPETVRASSRRAPATPTGAPVPAAPAGCRARCVEANQMRAVAPEAIEEDCRRECETADAY